MSKAIEEKAHAELSASGSERWLNCPGSVILSREAPEKEESKWAKEGTKAHDLLELWLNHLVKKGSKRGFKCTGYPPDMIRAVEIAVDFVIEQWNPEEAELVPEEKLSLEFVGPDMFGTSDIQITEYFGRLRVWDYKHGKGKIVDCAENNPVTGGVSHNTQLVYYGLAAAHKYGYDFQDVELGIIQPRAPYTVSKATYQDTIYYDDNNTIRSVILTMDELKKYIDLFKKGVDRVYSGKQHLYVGRWCHWCPAFDICPKQEKLKVERVADMFDDFEDEDDFEDLGF